jgi:hypothetical protein
MALVKTGDSNSVILAPHFKHQNSFDLINIRNMKINYKDLVEKSKRKIIREPTS